MPDSRTDTGAPFCLDASRDECEKCGMQAVLKCRASLGSILSFSLRFLLFFVPAFLGFQEGGRGDTALGWVAAMVGFFLLVLPAVLCSYCPYYHKKGRIVFCISTLGTIKIRKPRHGPMSTMDRIVFLVGFVMILAFPFPFLIMDGLFLYGSLALAGLVLFAVSEVLLSCRMCVNFACPLNRVPESIREKYLKKKGLILP